MKFSPNIGLFSYHLQKNDKAFLKSKYKNMEIAYFKTLGLYFF